MTLLRPILAVLLQSFTGSRGPQVQGPAAVSAPQTIYHVSVIGNDTAARPGNPRLPFRSLSGAYSAIPDDITNGSGDHVIQLMDGATYGQLTMARKRTDAAHRIVLRGAPGTTPVMDAHFTGDGSPGRVPDNITLRVLTDHVVVQGIRFIHTGRITDRAFARENPELMVFVEGSNVVFDDNYFDGNTDRPTIADIGVVVCRGARDLTFTGNRWDNLGGKSQLHVSASCGTGDSPKRLVIRNNIFSRFAQAVPTPTQIGAALNFGGSSGTRAGDSSIVENNTFWNNGGAHYGILNTNGSVLTVRNNIFAGITGERVAAIGCSRSTGGSSGVVYNSVMFGNTNDIETSCPGAGWQLNTVFREDPYFVNTSAVPPDLHVESTEGSRRNGSTAWTRDGRCSVAARLGLGAHGNAAERSRPCGNPTPLPEFTPFGAFGERIGAIAAAPGITVTLVAPAAIDPRQRVDLVLYALPNGNTTAETMGRKLTTGMSWRFDIQHIAAQTRALRTMGMPQAVVAYLEADSKSWPDWRRRQGYAAANARIVALVDEIRAVVGRESHVTLTGHSGGGSFMFGFIEGQDSLPSWLDRIAFLDANYNFAPIHGPPIINWLRRDAAHQLVVLAYDDREIMLDGKKVVSDSGGTWRASRRMIEHLRDSAAVRFVEDSIGGFVRQRASQIDILVHPNPANRILHTEMIGEMNGYLHAMLTRRPAYERGPTVLKPSRAYSRWVDSSSQRKP